LRTEQTPANHFMANRSKSEFNLAARFNPTVLGPHDPSIPDGYDEDSWEALLGSAMHAIGDMYVILLHEASRRPFGDALAVSLNWFHDNQEGLPDLRDLVQEAEGPSFDDLKAALRAFDEDVVEADPPDANAVIRAITQLHDALFTQRGEEGSDEGGESSDRSVTDVSWDTDSQAGAAEAPASRHEAPSPRE